MPSPHRLWAGRRPGEHHASGRRSERPGAQPLRRRFGPGQSGGPGDGTDGAEEPQGGRLTTRVLALALTLALVAGLGGGLLAVTVFDDDTQTVNIAGGKGRLPASTVGRVYAAAGPGVVSVRAGGASGTGFVVDRDGTIVTNAHVVQGEDRASVRFGDRGRSIRATVLGIDASSDLAALRVDPSRVRDLRPIPRANSDEVQVGDDVVAIGHPFGLERTATAGIVSGVGRRIQAPNGFQIDKVIQTDAAINPGNSGGPLLDARGRVIGINSQIATGGNRGNVGVGFAVPSNTLNRVIERLKHGQRISRPYLGITTNALVLGGSGARVADVAPGGPADDAGLREGDIIVEVDGRRIDQSDEVSSAIAGKRPGDTVQIVISRDGDRRTVEVRLGSRPDRGP
jgi:S1-C subfamily serine protease